MLQCIFCHFDTDNSVRLAAFPELHDPSKATQKLKLSAVLNRKPQDSWHLLAGPFRRPPSAAYFEVVFHGSETYSRTLDLALIAVVCLRAQSSAARPSVNWAV